MHIHKALHQCGFTNPCLFDWKYFKASGDMRKVFCTWVTAAFGLPILRIPARISFLSNGRSFLSMPSHIKLPGGAAAACHTSLFYKILVLHLSLIFTGAAKTNNTLAIIGINHRQHRQIMKHPQNSSRV
ncbi:MAG: hypothetical protein HRU20_01685 [Pseudomonadales bacterium]|nr:hypothetical protein [Pseudomonadales bacterium]